MNRQNKTKLYAKALAEIVLEKHARQNATAFGAKKLSADAIVRNFVKYLEKNGQMHRAKEILNLAEDLFLAKQGKRKIIIETARKMTVNQKKILGNFVKEGDVFKEKVNPEIIAGIKIIINNEKQFDASMQNKLQNIF